MTKPLFSYHSRRPFLLHEVCRQLPVLRRLILRVLLPIVGLYALVVVQPFVPFSVLLRDANVTPYDPEAGVMFYRGALSNVGILLWWASAVVCAFTAYLLKRSGSRGGVEGAFFAYLAVFTGLLALDDLFMIHEELLPVVLGIPEAIMYALYGILSLGLLRFIRLVFDADFLILGLAFGFFTLSIVTDQIGGPALTGLGLLIEDLSKMLGIVCWLAFTTRTAVQMILVQSARLSRHNL